MIFEIFLMFGAFSMKRKRATNAQIQNTNPKLRTPLLGKNTWETVNSFALPQTEMKFNEIHKSFSQFPTKFVNISEDIKAKLNQKKMSWGFFKHLETHKTFAQNVDEKTEYGMTALHSATNCNEVEVAKALVEAGVDINAQTHCGATALFFAAICDRLEIGKVLVDEGADLGLKAVRIFRQNPGWQYRKNSTTALQIAEDFNHGTFVKMLRKNMKTK